MSASLKCQTMNLSKNLYIAEASRSQASFIAAFQCGIVILHFWSFMIFGRRTVMTVIFEPVSQWGVRPLIWSQRCCHNSFTLVIFRLGQAKIPHCRGHRAWNVSICLEIKLNYAITAMHFLFYWHILLAYFIWLLLSCHGNGSVLIT